MFKRSLALVLSVLMVITMFAVAASAAEPLEPYTSYMNEGWSDLWHLAADNFSSDEEDSNWHNFHKVAQEFVPENDVVTGVKFGMILTGGTSVVHVEIRKGDVNSEAIYATDVPVNSRGNRSAMYEIGFDQEVAVTPGEVYYVAFWFTTRTAGNIAVVRGGTANGHSAYNYRVQDGGETTFTKTGSAVNFEIISTPGMNKLVRHNDVFTDGTFHIDGFKGMRADDNVKTEGMSSMIGGWDGKDITTDNDTKAHACFAIQNGGISFANAKYFVFDLYLEGVTINNPSGVRFGDATGWSSIFAENNTQEFRDYLKTAKEGWNTIVVPLPDHSGWATKNVANIWIAFDNSDSLILSKNDALMGFDNFRIMDEKGYQAYLASQEPEVPEEPEVPAPVVDGEKDELYTDAKSMTITQAFAGVGGAAAENTTQATIKTYYAWDDAYNYVYMEISEPGYAYTGQNADVVYYVNQPDVSNYFFQNAGGGYIQWTIAQGVDGATSAGSTLAPAEKAGYIDGATGQTRRYEFKFDRDPASPGFFVSPVVYGSASYVVGYHSFYSTNGHFVKYEDESTWAYTDVKPVEPEEPEKVIYDESLLNLDVVGAITGTRAGITVADNKNFTEGTGSHYVTLGDANVNNFEILVYGTNESGSNAVTNTQDISKFINADGEFYVTFDMYVSDPSIVTKSRFMFGMGCYVPGKYEQIASSCLALNANTQAGKNATWADFGLTDGVKAGWNKLAIKLDCSEDSKYLEGKDITRWDATKVRFFRFYADGFTANAANQIRFDDLRVMTVDAYEANFAARNAAKDVVIAINELPADATAADEAVVAIKEAYAALSDEQKAMVPNYSKVENLEAPAQPEDYQLSSMDSLAMVVIPGGNQATGGTQGKVYKNNYVEGTAANFSNWGTKEVGTALEGHMCLVGLGGVDLSKYDYITFDLYLHGISHNWQAGKNDCNVGFGTGNAWNNTELGWVGNSVVGPQLNKMQEGWNHVIIPINFNGSANVMRFYSTALSATAEDPYMLFDDFRLINEDALAIDADRTAAKAVIAQIATLDAADDAAIAAVEEAYAALSEAQQAYVTNYGVIAEIAATKKAAADVVDAINGLKGNTFMFNDCNTNNDEGGTEIIANYNSGALDKEVTAEGYAKFILKADGAPDFPMTFRNGTGVVPADYSELVFDIFVSEGMEIVTGSWGNTHYQTGFGSIDEHKVDSIGLAPAFEKLVPGQWNTVRMTASTKTDLIKQITLRPYGIFKGAAGDYVLVDNIRFEATNEITYADKADVAAVKDAYDALSDAGKALVTNVADLDELVAYMTAQEEAAAAVVNAINALPAVEELTVDDQAALNAANAALAALEADTKDALVAAELIEKVAALNVKMEELIASTDVGELCTPVVSAIDALPAVDAVRTSDAAAINSAKELFDGLSDEAKTYMDENYAAQVEKLNAVVAELANEQQFEADAQAIIDAIAALPTTVKVADEEAVNAAKAAYDAASADIQYYVTNKAVLDAAIAALAADKADKAAADALNEKLAFLLEIDEVLEEDVEWIQGMYDEYVALSANAKAYIPEESVKVLEEAYTASRMFGPIDVQFRAFEKFGADAAKDGTAGREANKFGKDTVQPIEGKSSLAISWDKATSNNEFHMFIYHYNQGQVPGGAQWETDVFEGEGAWEVPCPSASKGTLNLVFDLYVSDAAALRNASSDCGFGFDADQPNAWGGGGQGGGANKAVLMAAFDAANGGKGLQDGWNQVILPLGLNKNYKGQVLTVYDMRFYFIGVNITDGFTVKLDDIRFMNQEAIDTILPGRSAAKQVTLSIYDAADDYTYAEGLEILKAYDAVPDENKELVIGMDEFVADFVTKFEEQIAADVAAAVVVEAQIDDLFNTEIMFNDCEALTVNGLEVVANLNSGGDNKSLAEGQGVDGGNAAKFTKKATGASEFNEVFRVAEPIDFTGAEFLEFDLFISEGMTITPGWSPVYLQSGYHNNNDNDKIASIDMKDMMGDWCAGEWNHVVISLDSVPEMVRSALAQVSVRLYNTLSGEAGEYIMIDNMMLAGEKAITLENKADVEAARAAYDALTDTQKAYISNLADLEDAEATIAELEKAAQEAADKEAAAAVDAVIAELPAEIALTDKAAVEDARAAYDALTDDQKAFVEGLATLEAAEAKIAELQAAADKAEADKAAAAAVDAAIAALNVETLEDKADVEAARAAYDALTDDQKAFVEGLATLEAAEAKIAELEAAAAIKLGDVNGDGKIGADDALEVLKSVVGKVELTEDQVKAADVNKDGNVNAEDALEILKEVVGKDNCF